jgi:NADH-quinone oxidoreductase subunit I
VKGIAKGMATVLRNMVRPSFTEAYPWAPKVLPERSRTWFELPLDENGVPFCKSCMLCARNCPDGAITIESSKREDGPGRVLESFSIDLGLCMYCGLCVENCTSSGLRFTGDFETATHDRDRMRLVLYEVSDTTAPISPVLDENPVEPDTAAPDASGPGDAE